MINESMRLRRAYAYYICQLSIPSSRLSLSYRQSFDPVNMSRRQRATPPIRHAVLVRCMTKYRKPSQTIANHLAPTSLQTFLD